MPTATAKRPTWPSSWPSSWAQCLPAVRFLPIDLTYFLRSGEPEVYDKHMAIFYANLVMSLVRRGTHGVMAAHRDGHFIYTDMPGKNLSARRVDPADYNATTLPPELREHRQHLPAATVSSAGGSVGTPRFCVLRAHRGAGRT